MCWQNAAGWQSNLLVAAERLVLAIGGFEGKGNSVADENPGHNVFTHMGTEARLQLINGSEPRDDTPMPALREPSGLLAETVERDIVIKIKLATDTPTRETKTPGPWQTRHVAPCRTK